MSAQIFARIGSSLGAGVLLITLGFASCCSAADTYPSKPGRLILAFPPSGGTDIVARLFAGKFSEMLGQTLVVDNRPGAGGIIGTQAAARAAPDGHTLFVYGVSQTITAAQYKNLPYDHIRDFAPVSMYAAVPNILVVHPSVPAKNIKEFIAFAKSAPGKMTYMSSGIGASPHLTMELFKSGTGIDLVHVPYKDVAQGFTDLVGGRTEAAFGNLPAHLQNVRSGRLRALVVTSAKRVEQLPEVPTVIESGLPGFEVTVWQGIAVPAATPKPIIDRLHAAMMKALAAPDLQQRFAKQGASAWPTTPEEFAAYIKSETVRWAKVVKDSGASLD